MAMIKLSVVTPTGAVLETETASITAPSVGGEMNVLPDHRPALVKLGGGLIRYSGESGTGEIFIRGGVAEVRPDAMLVLADEAVLADQVDREVAEKVLNEALAQFNASDFLDDDRVGRLAADRAYAEAMLKAVGH